MSEHRRGPVRSEAARVAILEATARLFAARGYDHLSVEGVAHEAGVGKQTIYRWWPSKSALVAECLFEGMLMPERFSFPVGGDVRTDVTRWTEQVFEFLGDPGNQTLLRSLIAAAAENADVGRRLRESLGAPDSLVDRLQLAVDAGELEPDAPLHAIGDALIGAVLVRALARIPPEPRDTATLIAVVLGG